MVKRYEFLAKTEEDTQFLARETREFVKRLLIESPDNIYNLGLSGDPGMGKSVFANEFVSADVSLGQPISQDDHSIYVSNDFNRNASDGDLRINENFIPNKTLSDKALGTVSWIDASWYVDAEEDVVSRNRAAFLSASTGETVTAGGVNIFEHPECCEWDPELDFLYELEEDSDEDDRVLITLTVSDRIEQHELFENLVERCAELDPDKPQGIHVVTGQHFG